jgi:TetR/AcrR family transcriptional repressor of mexJK operon
MRLSGVVVLESVIAVPTRTCSNETKRYSTFVAESSSNSEPHGGQANHQPTGRVAAKRQAILAAATTVFLRDGYHGSSMDEITAVAAVSKPTVYRHYADKGELFGAVVRATMDRLDRSFHAEALALDTDADPYPLLCELARRVLTGLLDPEVLRLRRLVIGESARFPELGKAYWEHGFQKGLATLADGMRRLAARGRLNIADPALAAGQFAGMVLWVPVNQALLCGIEAVTPAEVDRHVDAGVLAFLAAHGRG